LTFATPKFEILNRLLKSVTIFLGISNRLPNPGWINTERGTMVAIGIIAGISAAKYGILSP
jgi:hypothetical protein